MQAPLVDLLLTAGLAGGLAMIALASVAALPWSAAELRATEGALGRGAQWVRTQVLLALAGAAACPPQPPGVREDLTFRARARAA